MNDTDIRVADLPPRLSEALAFFGIDPAGYERVCDLHDELSTRCHALCDGTAKSTGDPEYVWIAEHRA